MAKASRLAFGAVMGAVAGVVAGVLTAPKSGKETRADIKAKAEELKARAEKAKGEAMETASGITNDVKARLGKK